MAVGFDGGMGAKAAPFMGSRPDWADAVVLESVEDRAAAECDEWLARAGEDQWRGFRRRARRVDLAGRALREAVLRPGEWGTKGIQGTT